LTSTENHGEKKESKHTSRKILRILLQVAVMLALITALFDLVGVPQIVKTSSSLLSRKDHDEAAQKLV
jgi:lipopolysaccharide export LptBFGC system permease protein LptF